MSELYNNDFIKKCMAGLLVLVFMSGCAGFRESTVTLDFDENSLEPTIRKSLQTARKLTFVGPKDATEMLYQANHLEDSGYYEVSVERLDLGTASQNLATAKGFCRSGIRPDIVIYPSADEPETNAGMGMVAQATFTGRATMTIKTSINVLRCRDNYKSQIRGSVTLDQGMYNADRNIIDQKLGKAYAEEFLVIAGHRQRPSDNSNVRDQNLLWDVQQELSRKGYYSGVIDGLYGPQTRRAIVSYQNDSGLAEDGQPSEELLRHLLDN